jgi:tetratricopeptide (TPR) repeat protein
MKTIKTAMAALFLFMAGALLEAQNFPSLEASPNASGFAQRMAGNKIHWRDLAEAALWASSVNSGPGAEEKAAAYLDRINLAVAELTAAELSEIKKERGEYVLTFLHKRFLKSYSEYQTRVDEIFVSGKYNCVSSAVLYMVLGLSVGLDVGGVKTKDHAFATVTAGTEIIDVETTNQYGFDPGNRKEFQDAFGKTTGYAYVPLKNYRDRASINGAELVSLILSNRIAVLERGNRFAEAVPLAINRAVFLTGNTASGDKTELFGDPQKDLMDCLINLGSYLLKAGKEDDVIAWTEYAGGRFPDSRRWPELFNSAVNNKLVKLIRAKKPAETRAALTALKPKLDEENYQKLDTMVLEAEAGDIVNSIRNSGDAEAALAFLAQVWERLPSEGPSGGRREEMRTVTILAEANRFGKARDWAGAMRWLSSAMETYGTNAKLETALRDMRKNRVSELHNEFAALYNKKDYAGAKASTQKSLKEFPNERQLLQDLDLAEKALARQ